MKHPVLVASLLGLGMILFAPVLFTVGTALGVRAASVYQHRARLRRARAALQAASRELESKENQP